MSNIQQSPLKLYIQDIFRAKTTTDKYIYEIFGLKFKNIMIHGVITSIYNTTTTAMNLEVSDATGSVLIYYDKSKSNSNPSAAILKDLSGNFSEATRAGNDNTPIMSSILDRVINCARTFTEGDYISVVGDIFVDAIGTRMISGYECRLTSVERDVVWMEELRYLYDKFYLCSK